VRAVSWLAYAGQLAMIALAGAYSLSLGPIMLEARVPHVPPEFDGELARRGLQQPFVVWSDGAEAAALFPRARVVATQRWTPELVDLVLTEGPPDVVDRRLPLDDALRAVLEAGPGGAWWLAEQSPDDDPRCPEGRLALLSTTPETLLGQLAQDLAQDSVARALFRWRCALAALEGAHLPDEAARRALAVQAGARAEQLERDGRLEQAVRAAALAATLSGEAVPVRSRAERLRAKWLATRGPEQGAAGAYALAGPATAGGESGVALRPAGGLPSWPRCGRSLRSSTTSASRGRSSPPARTSPRPPRTSTTARWRSPGRGCTCARTTSSGPTRPRSTSTATARW
jgi:hypothetical protein